MSNNFSPIVIGIAGGTASGKSTLAENIKKEFENQITMISHDSYYKDHKELTFDERKLLNYDHPGAFDTSMLINHIQMLKEGKPIERPNYSFATHLRESETTTVYPNKVIIIDGILIFENKVLRDSMDIKVFVDTDSGTLTLSGLNRRIRA